jgi:hypothetical protein
MAQNQRMLNPELVEWLNERQASLNIAKTTTTRSGKVLDWVPLESQVDEGRIATAPPALTVAASVVEQRTQRVRFETDEEAEERGPEGTVPILRPDLSLLTQTVKLQDYLRKRGGPRRLHGRTRGHESGQAGSPQPAGYFHNISSEDGNFFGWSGIFNVWDPVVGVPGESDNDHSILQAWVLDGGETQSVEGGWTVHKRLNGDLLPHLFLFYTTNAYAKEGNYLGGYNRQYKGWVQYSGPTTTGRTIYPGIAITSLSVFDGAQFEMPLAIRLFQEPGTQTLNWWVACDGIWIGYYPASLYGKGVLATHAETLMAGGEVDSRLKNPEMTKDQMGAGLVASAGFGRAAYIRNLEKQIDLVGHTTDSNGDPVNDVATPGGADPYSGVLNNQSGTDWGSFLFVGGQGDASGVLATWQVNDGPLPGQSSRASDDADLLPPSGADAVKFSISGTAQNVTQISFDVVIDRSGSDKTCWAGIGDGTVVGIAGSLAHAGMSLAQANGRGFYVGKVKGATQPFTLTAEVDV